MGGPLVLNVLIRIFQFDNSLISDLKNIIEKNFITEIFQSGKNKIEKSLFL